MKLLLFGVLLFELVIGGCPAAFAPADLQSGRVSASVTSNNDFALVQQMNSFNYTLALPFATTPQVSIATNYLEAQQIQSVYYLISCQNNQTSDTTLPFTVSIQSTNNWVTIRWTFLASAKTDFQLGQFDRNITSNNQSQQIVAQLAKRIANPTIYLFITGFNISINGLSKQFQGESFSIISKQVNGSSLKVTVSSREVVFISLSYVIYNSPSASANYVIRAGESRVSSTNIDLSKSITQLNIHIFGMSQFENPSKVVFSFEAIISSSYTLTTVSNSFAKLTISYLLIQNLQQNFCSGCPTGNIYDGSGCVVSCAGNTFYKAIKSNVGICVQCQAQNYMIIDPIKGNCRCADQTYQVGTICRPCHWSCATCIAPDQNKCLTCDLSTPVTTNRYYFQGRCICLNGFYEDNMTGSCNQCSYSCLACNGPSSSECTSCNVNLFRKMSTNRCICYDGYVDDGVNGMCQCKTFLPNGTCSVPPCPLNSAKNLNDVCECKTGYANISGVCSLCPANSIVVNSQCQCVANFIRSGNVCKQCPQNSFKNSETSCICNNGFSNVSGVCVACTGGRQVINGTCQCPTNLFFDNRNTCRGLKIGQISRNGSIICAPGYENKSGQCIASGLKPLSLLIRAAEHFKGQFRLSLELTSMPPQLLSGGSCAQCRFVITSYVYKADVYPTVSVNFVAPKTFQITYDFRGRQPIGIFYTIIKFDPNLAKILLSAYNTSQVLNLLVDTSRYPIK